MEQLCILTLLRQPIKKDEKTIHTFGKEYLLSKNQENQPLTAKECSFCHIEKATDEIELSIQQRGYYIIEMQNCK